MDGLHWSIPQTCTTPNPYILMQIRRDFQDTYTWMPMCDDRKSPRGKVCIGVPSPSLQAHIPTHEAIYNWSWGLQLPRWLLPCQSLETCASIASPWLHTMHYSYHRTTRHCHPTILGGQWSQWSRWSCSGQQYHQHFHGNEEGKCMHVHIYVCTCISVFVCVLFVYACLGLILKAYFIEFQR